MYADDSDEFDSDHDIDDYDPDDPETYPAGVYADDRYPTIPSPHCHEEVAEDVAACPYCGNHLSAEDAPRERRSLFWVAMMLLALAAVVLMALVG